MILKESVNQIIEAYLADTDYYLVDLKISGDNRIAVEIDRFEGVSIDFCSELSKTIESKLDRDEEDYELEVSSAGLTEPFKVRKQYEKNLGNEVEVLTKEGKKQIGILKKINEENIWLEQEKQVKPEGAKRKTTIQEEILIPFNNIKTTKYIIRFK
jgi:ribosome maturation factor RimP